MYYGNYLKNKLQKKAFHLLNNTMKEKKDKKEHKNVVNAMMKRDAEPNVLPTRPQPSSLGPLRPCPTSNYKYKRNTI